MRDHGSRANECVLADRNSADDRGVCSKRCAALNQGALIFRFPVYVAARSDHIRKNHRWPTENVVFQFHTRVQGDVVLNFDVVANAYSAGDVYVLPQNAHTSDPAFSHYMRKMPDLGAVADFAWLVHYRARMHKKTPLRSGLADHGPSMVADRLSCSVQDFEHSQAILSISARIDVISDALQKVQALKL
jgi:hypothetical protein